MHSGFYAPKTKQLISWWEGNKTFQGNKTYFILQLYEANCRAIKTWKHVKNFLAVQGVFFTCFAAVSSPPGINILPVTGLSPILAARKNILSLWKNILSLWKNILSGCQTSFLVHDQKSTWQELGLNLPPLDQEARMLPLDQTGNLDAKSWL